MPSSTLVLSVTTPALADERPVYLTGNFCNWVPNVPTCQLQPVGPGRYEIRLPIMPEMPWPLTYKYTRGSWSDAELDEQGQQTPNRICRKKSGLQTDTVPYWQWNGFDTRAEWWPHLRLLSERFRLPQLRAVRRIRVLVPYDYDDSTETYPVLYLQDGQNLAGHGSAFGSWHIDHVLARLASRRQHNIIVVLIDHGHRKRLYEYTPERTIVGSGGGTAYIHFMIHTLKPRIDSLFRTRPDAANTGIGGSSMGGLISLYAALHFPHIFGRLMSFSPSLWAWHPVYAQAAQFHTDQPVRWFVAGSRRESRMMEASLQHLSDQLSHAPSRFRMDFTLLITPTGKHNEAYWSSLLPVAIRTLFF